MNVKQSHRPHREWFWFLLAILIVGGITVPLWQYFRPQEISSEYWSKWTKERIAKLLLGPEQMLCYVCFVWSSLLLMHRYQECLRQRAAVFR